jgi:hypothetical protein
MSRLVKNASSHFQFFFGQGRLADGHPDNGETNSNFGQISGVRSPPRQIQFSLHYRF